MFVSKIKKNLTFYSLSASYDSNNHFIICIVKNNPIKIIFRDLYFDNDMIYTKIKEDIINIEIKKKNILERLYDRFKKR